MGKYILVHSGARDQYKVAEYLEKNKLLQYFVTDDFIFRRAYHNIIAPDKIKTSWLALFFRLLEIKFPKKKFNKIRDYLLSRKAGKLSKRLNIPIFAYSYYASEAFSISELFPKILFQLHPHPKSVKRILKQEIDTNPLSRNSLSREVELLYTEKEFEELSKETRLADYYIAASNFTKKTLVENGIKADRIEVVPYGVNTEKFAPRDCFRSIQRGENIRLLFVGSFNQRKGLSYLLRAVEELQHEGFPLALTLCGRGIMDFELLNHFKLNDFKYYVDLPLKNLVALMHQSDVFIFPSLCEGFGLVLLEAMATGLPVITTDRTSGVDFITQGKEGFVIEAQNVTMLKKYILKFVTNPELVSVMGAAAISKSSEFSWDLFGEKLVKALQKFEGHTIEH